MFSFYVKFSFFRKHIGWEESLENTLYSAQNDSLEDDKITEWKEIPAKCNGI